MFYTNFEGNELLTADEICARCFGAGSQIKFEGNEPCHAGPYFPYEVTIKGEEDDGH